MTIAQGSSPRALACCVAASTWLACARVPATITAEARPPTQIRPAKPSPIDAAWYGELELEPRARPPRARPRTAAPRPSVAELEAWQRGEVQPSAADLANREELTRFWRELECLRLAMLSVGNATYNDFDPEGFEAFAYNFADVAEQWMIAIIHATPPEQIESQVLGVIVEAFGALIEEYPVAYANEDIDALEHLDELWDDYRRRVEQRLPGLDTQATRDVDHCRAFLDDGR